MKHFDDFLAFRTDLDCKIRVVRRILRRQRREMDGNGRDDAEAVRRRLQEHLHELRQVTEDCCQKEGAVFSEVVSRIFTDEPREISQLRDEQSALLEALEKTIKVARRPLPDGDVQTWFWSVEEQFKRFVRRFDRHSMKEATFLNVHSNLLFPGSVFTG